MPSERAGSDGAVSRIGAATERVREAVPTRAVAKVGGAAVGTAVAAATGGAALLGAGVGYLGVATAVRGAEIADNLSSRALKRSVGLRELATDIGTDSSLLYNGESRIEHGVGIAHAGAASTAALGALGIGPVGFGVGLAAFAGTGLLGDAAHTTRRLRQPDRSRADHEETVDTESGTDKDQRVASNREPPFGRGREHSSIGRSRDQSETEQRDRR